MNTEKEKANTGIEKKSNNKKVLLGATGLVVALFMILQIVTYMTEQNAQAIAKPSSSQSTEEKDRLMDEAMRAAQQQMGDDFYKAASGGAPIPSDKPAQPQPKAEPTSQQVQKTTAPQPTANTTKATPKTEKNKGEEFVTVNLSPNVGRANPFVPAVNVGSYEALGIPQLPKSNYPLPPTELIQNETAVKLMQTTISGIMYDSLSPSAIISVEGQDHLVRKGDRINGYKVLNITKDRVIVQNGTNVYRATVGETLTTQDNAVIFNTVDNLQTKFAGGNAAAGTKMIEIK